VIAEELSREFNPKRVLELSQELNIALEQQGTGSMQPSDGDAHIPPKRTGKPKQMRTPEGK
jgi:hypothetical protein